MTKLSWRASSSKLRMRYEIGISSVQRFWQIWKDKFSQSRFTFRTKFLHSDRTQFFDLPMKIDAVLTMVDPPCSSHEFLDKINTAQRASQHTHTVFPKQFNTKFNKSHFDEHIDASRQRNKRRLTSYNTLCLVIMLAKDAPLRQSVGLYKSPHLQNPIVSSTDQPSHTVSI